MTLAAALTQLKTWSPTGVTTNKGVIFEPVPEADLPALVVDLAVSIDFAEGAESAVVTQDQGILIVHLDHKLLMSGLGLGLASERGDDVVELVDAYVQSWRADMDLNGELAGPIRIVQVSMGTVKHADVYYSGVTFRHQWRLKVAAP